MLKNKNLPKIKEILIINNDSHSIEYRHNHHQSNIYTEDWSKKLRGAAKVHSNTAAKYKRVLKNGAERRRGLLWTRGSEEHLAHQSCWNATRTLEIHWTVYSQHSCSNPDFLICVFKYFYWTSQRAGSCFPV